MPSTNYQGSRRFADRVGVCLVRREPPPCRTPGDKVGWSGKLSLFLEEHAVELGAQYGEVTDRRVRRIRYEAEALLGSAPLDSRRRVHVRQIEEVGFVTHMAAIARSVPVHDQRNTGLIRRLAGQPTDHIVRVDDERIGQAKASRTLPQVYGDRIARDEGCPK